MFDPMRSDGAPSVDFMKCRLVKKTRKSHTCSICKKPILVGSTAEETSGMTSDDKKPWTMYIHYPLCIQS